MNTFIRIAWNINIISLLALSGPAMSAPSVQHIFSNGQPANADQVNENFQELADRIEEIPIGPKGDQGDPGPAGAGVVEINFDPYRHNFASKTFQILDNNVSGLFAPEQTEIRTYDRSTPGLLIETRETIDIATSQTVAGEKRYYTTGTGQDKVWTKREIYAGWDVVDEVIDFTPGTPVFFTTMTVGVPRVSTSIRRNTIPPGVVPPIESIVIDTRTLISQESIMVNGNTYDDCLKVLVERGNPSGQTVHWYCAGYGLVKRVSTRILELIEVVEQ